MSSCLSIMRTIRRLLCTTKNITMTAMRYVVRITIVYHICCLSRHSLQLILPVFVLPTTIMESVINLSDRMLSTDEISVLSRGLKFCPTPACPDPGLGRDDLDKLHRRLRLKSFFEDLPKNDDTVSEIEQNRLRNDSNLHSRVAFKHSKFKRPSTWRGPSRSLYS